MVTRRQVRDFGRQAAGLFAKPGAAQKGFAMWRTVTPTVLGPAGQVLAWRDATPWERLDNALTDVGMAYLHNVGFAGVSAAAAWYGGLIDNSGFTAVNRTDTMASHAGWAEFTNYSGANRPTWTAGTIVTPGEQPGTGALTFTISGGGGTLRGAFLASGQVKGETASILYAHKADSTGRTVAAGQAQQVFYTSVLTPGS